MATYRRDAYALSRPAPQGGHYVIPLKRHEGGLEDNILHLSGVGGRLWELLEQPQDQETLSAALLAEYEVGKDELRRDLGRFLAELVDVRCLEQSP